MHSAPPTQPSRLAGLDGLRGLAALAVVTLHVLVASSRDLEPFLTGERLLGQEWVIVFFVLSGLVLSLAAADGAAFNPVQYYPARLLRLYIPVWGALLLAAGAHELIHHGQVEGATAWLNSHSAGWTAGTTFHEVTLVFRGGDYYFTSVLWSLRAEILFSLLLPLYLWVAVRVPLRFVVAGSILAMVIVSGDFLLVYYMLTFVLGVALAFRREQVTGALSDPRLYGLVLAASPVLMTATWWMPGARGAALAMVALGATGLVALGMNPGVFARMLNTRSLREVGRVSFSLYLVHEPIIVATAFALGGRPAPVLLAVCSAPFVIAATLLFYRWVEDPSHSAARRIGARASATTKRATPAPRPSTFESGA